MAPATTGGSSRAARKSQPVARPSKGETRASSRPAASTKRAAAPVKGGRTGKALRSPAAPPSAVRKGKTAPRTAVAKTTKAARKAATKATVKTAVTSTSRTTKETKETRASGGSKVVKTAKAPRQTGAPATSRSPASKAPQAKAPEAKAPQAKAAQAKAPQAGPDASSRRVAAVPQRKPASRRAPAAPAGPYAQDERFLSEQRQLLEAERAVYQAQASDLKAEADSLAQEREPGDVQFDEESGEGGTVTVDRERDLALSAQALAAVEEIDAAMEKIANGTYGACERCQQPIPKPRLKALPYARLCVACKSGGLSRR
jgi:DnaK suppressor protein